MKKIIILLFVIICFFSSVFADEIYLDQLGYLTTSPKITVVEGAPIQFKIYNQRGVVLLTGNKGAEFLDPDTGKKVSKIDFSKLTTPGKYFLCFGNVRRELIIGDNPYEKARFAALRSYYLQRCGTQIEDSKTGLKHDRCHTQEAAFLLSTGRSGQKNVSGGWHDAGDYGKYIPPANYAVSTLLFSVWLNSFGSHPLLAELKYELDWLFRMQDEKSGGVYHKVTGETFEPFVLPDRDNKPLYISRVSSAATAGFAGTMAQASLAFKNSDPPYADKLLKAAIRAWQFLEVNQNIRPSGGFDNEPEIKTGVYGDTDDGDERLFAAVQLLGATGNQKYRNYFTKNYVGYDSSSTAKLGWQDFRQHAFISYLLLPEKLADNETKSAVKRRFIAFAEKLVRRAEKNGFGVVLQRDDYRWGSNGLLMDYAKALLFAHLFTGEQKYRDLALEQLHYILGRNAHDLCFVTGFGDKTVIHLHHRPSIASGLELPGFLAGGPNRFLQDEKTRAAFRADSPPALMYLDNKDSYSTNENSIYWNASLVLVLRNFSKGYTLPQ